MKSATRRIHDLHSSIVNALGPALRRRTEPHPANLVENRQLLPAGEADHSNRLESWFYATGQDTVRHEWPETVFIQLRDVWSVGDQGRIFFSDGSAFDASASLKLLPAKKIRRPIPALSRTIDEPVFHLTGVSHESHGHFLLHHLPRLVAARDFLREHEEVLILCAEGHRRWQARYLARFGIDESRIVTTTHGTLKLRELYIVPRVQGTFNLAPPRHYLRMREALVAPVLSGPPLEKSAAPLFVSRRDAPDKILGNEEEIVRITGEVWGDVNLVELGRHSMDEQIALFRAAPLVIGALGQGLTNILYTEGTPLVILDHRAGPAAKGPVCMFRTLAAICGGDGLGLHSESGYEGPRRAWKFDPELFRGSLLRLKDHLGS